MSNRAIAEQADTTATFPEINKRWRKVKATIEGLLYLAPTLIILGIFTFLPIITSFNLSLNCVAPFGNQMRYVGLENYTRLLTDPEYWNTVRISLVFMAATVIVGIILAVGMAIALSIPIKRLSWFHRLLIFVPIVISSAVTGVIFRWLYHPVVGYINYWLSIFGIDGPNWLATKDWALTAVIIAVIWNQLGFNVIIALAGVQKIDSTYYEAAKVDGANAWQRLRRITIPMVSPTTFFLLVIQMLGAFQIFVEPFVMTSNTQGQLPKASLSIVIYLYQNAFQFQRMGKAAAIAWVLFAIVLVLTFFQLRLQRRWVHYETE